LKPSPEKAAKGRIQCSFGDETLVKCNGEGLESVATLKIRSGPKCIDGSADGIGVRMVSPLLPEIVYSTAVGEQDTVVLPFIAEDMGEEPVISTAWLPIERRL
jgi:hypothetical protein